MAVFRTFQEPIFEEDKDMQDFFLDSLRGRGVEIKTLSPSRYNSFFEGDGSLDEDSIGKLADRLIREDLVAHNTIKFVHSMFGVDVRSGNREGDAGYLAKVGLTIDRVLNYALFKRDPSKCFNVYPPNEQNITRKNTMAKVLPGMGVPVPKTVPLTEFKMDFFPVYVKKINGSCGNDNQLVKDRKEFMNLKESYGRKDTKEYIVQEAYRVPTGFASNLRFVCFGHNVIGGMIYYDQNSQTKVNGAHSFGIPIIGSDMMRQTSLLEDYILDAYSLNQKDMDVLSVYASTVGRYGRKHGFPALTAEFVMESGTRRLGVIDVNAYFGLGIFHVLFNNDKGVTPAMELRKMAGEKFAEAYMANPHHE